MWVRALISESGMIHGSPGYLRHRLQNHGVHSPDLLVAEFIDHENRQWNDTSFVIVLDDATVVKVLCILLARKAHNVTLVWERKLRWSTWFAMSIAYFVALAHLVLMTFTSLYLQNYEIYDCHQRLKLQLDVYSVI